MDDSTLSSLIQNENAESELRDMTDWFRKKFKMLRSLARIQPNQKLTDDGEVFSIFGNTPMQWLYRTFFTNDSGENHVQKMQKVFDEIHDQVKTIGKNDNLQLDNLYLETLIRLMKKAQIGLTNWANHKDYINDEKIASPIQNIVNFDVPIIISDIGRILTKRRQPKKKVPEIIVPGQPDSSPKHAQNDGSPKSGSSHSSVGQV